MKERPILFHGAMVRAILDGSKTQTRRAIKLRYQEMGERDDGSLWPWSENPDTADDWWHACPYGQPGDRLWVRETWYCDDYRVQKGPYLEVSGALDLTVYRADNEQPFEAPEGYFWKPSIHMPRWASRILLEIVSVRVERLNDCSEADAKAEGVIPHVRGGWHWHKHDPANGDDWHQFGFKTAAFAYQGLWESINGAGSWGANPWVWVVEFKRVSP